jgi:vacuolar-type H+-ATPase subunit I/STV1
MNKAKRKITEFNFEEDGAHVALVDKAANEQTVLVMKALKKDEPEKDSQSSAASQDEDVVKAEDQKTTVEKNEENSMTQETEVQKSELEIELEKAKAQLADLEKAQEEKVALEKSLKEMSETITVLKAAEEKRKEAEYLEKAKQHAMVLTDDLPAADLAKALRLAEETEGCAALVKAFEAYRDMAAKSDALEEIGKSVADDRTVGTKLDMAIEKAMKDHGVDYMKALDVVQKESPELFAEEYKA